jgi:hypothetical protein
MEVVIREQYHQWRYQLVTNTTSGNGAVGSAPHDPVASVLNRPHPGQVALACAALGWRALPLTR